MINPRLKIKPCADIQNKVSNKIKDPYISCSVMTWVRKSKKRVIEKGESLIRKVGKARERENEQERKN